MPDEEADYLRVTHPFATKFKAEALNSVRLACVRHAASVCPEPGSNSPINIEESLTQKNLRSCVMKQCSVMKGRRIRDGVYNKLLEIVCQQIFKKFFRKSFLHYNRLDNIAEFYLES